MKKSLSLLLAIALVFGLFASMASAAENDLTTAQKYQQLKDKGILKGTTTGSDMLDDNLTRAQFATIAVAVLGLSEDNSAPSPFSDIKAGQWWYGAIKAASTAGLVNGIGNGKFGPKQTVTLQEVYKVAASALKLAPVTDAKVDGAAAWAAPYIQALIDAGFKLPSTNYKANATRGQTIEVAYDLYLAGQVQPLSDVSAVVNADDTITVTGKIDGDVDSVKVAIGSAAEAAATLKDDKTFTYTSGKQAAGTYTVKVTAYAGTKAVKSEEKSVTVDGFKVESVTVLNAKQVAVKFNKAVQEGTAVGGHNYSTGNDTYAYFLLAGKAPTKSVLSDDKTTVTLTFNKFQLNSYAQFEVKSGLKSASGKSLSAYKEALYLTDTTPPTVSKVEYIGKVAKLTFSEPVASEGTISINGGDISTSGTVYYSVDRETLGADTQINSISIHGLDLGVNYSFYLVGGKDFADIRFDYNTTLNVPSDTTAPTISSVTVDGAKIKVKYSEAIDSDYPGYASNVGYPNVKGVRDSSDNTLVVYDVSSWLTAASAKFLTLSVKISGYQDLVGNKGADSTQTLTISVDQTKPVYQSVSYDGNKVILKFSEAIANAPTTLKVKYTSNNNVVKETTANFEKIGYDADSNGSVSSDENAYVVYTLSAIEAGTYQFTLAAGTFSDTATPANTNDAATATLTVSAGSGSGVLTALIVTNGGTYNPNATPTYGVTVDHSLTNSQIRVEFSGGTDLDASTLDVNKFLLNGSPLPTGTVLYFTEDQKKVLITLPAGALQASGDRLIKVVDVVDKNGNTLNTSNESNYQRVVFLNENVAPVAQSITLTSDTSISVNFSETLASQGTTTGVELYINGNKYDPSQLQYSYNDKSLVIKATGSNVFNSTQSIKVKFSGSNVQDLKGNRVADGEISK